MKDLMIEKMNDEQTLYNDIKSLFSPYMSDELAELKTNEVMRLTGNSFTRMSADDLCPYCNQPKCGSAYCRC